MPITLKDRSDPTTTFFMQDQQGPHFFRPEKISDMTYLWV